MMDCHLHTTFSIDAGQTPDELCQTALARGLSHICITDHVDWAPRFIYMKKKFVIADPAAYVAAIDGLKERYPALSVTRGVEIGYIPHEWDRVLALRDAVEAEFVIGSLHVVKYVDPYEPRYFEGYTRRQAFGKYLLALRDAAAELCRVSHCLAHLDYVSKFAPYHQRNLIEYSEFPDIIDDILRTVIDTGTALEINTSGYRSRPEPLPGRSILARYHALGGRRICLGSDAHFTRHVGFMLREAAELARSLGFTRAVQVENGRLAEVPLP